MAPPSLLGPPELRRPTITPPLSHSQTTTALSDPSINLLVANFDKANTSTYNPPMGCTENGSATFLSSGNPCLDFFFHVVPDTPPESVEEWLRLAWVHNPLTTLKLICNLRGVRGTGKSDKEGFYAAVFWLHKNHPKTLACNLDSFVEFGCFKDLPEIIYRMLEGIHVRKIQKNDWNQRKFSSKSARMSKLRFRNKPGKTKKKSEGEKISSDAPKEIRIQNAIERARIEKENASALKKEKKIAMAEKVLDRYSRDPDFRFLYERVSDLFAECLKADMEFLKSGKFNKVGLAAKWCPSIGSSFDKSTLLCESIAKKMFPREKYPEYEGVEEEHYSYRVRDRLRKEVLVQLRKALELPEVYIGANRWDAIPYKRVASVAMKFYKEKFLKHDKERFSEYLKDVKSGKSTIAAGALLPHEIIASLKDEDGGEVAELQWQRMVNDLLEKGKLRNCLAVCDVSGSMWGIPMEVSVALGVLVSELSEEPWKGKIITFSEEPELQKVEGQNLKEKTKFVRNMNCGANTDFQKVFDNILKVAVEGQLKPEQMIKRLFVFSDMEFDEATYPWDIQFKLMSEIMYDKAFDQSLTNPYEIVAKQIKQIHSWETDYQVILKKFTEKGYGEAIPQIVFWNLRDSRATPVPGNQDGVALVSGFSKNLIKLFLNGDGIINPEDVMEAAISGEEYQKLVVVD